MNNLVGYPKRYRDAIAITQGAVNPCGVSNALHNACIEASREGKDTPGVCADPAVRLIAHQLAFLLKIKELDNDLYAYGKALDECQKEHSKIVAAERAEGAAEAEQRQRDRDPDRG